MSLTEGNRLPRMFAVVMSLPCVEVGVPIEKSCEGYTPERAGI
jgi:hypothetical protein